MAQIYTKGEVVWYWNAPFTSKAVGLIIDFEYHKYDDAIYYRVLTREGILKKTEPWLYPLK